MGHGPLIKYVKLRIGHAPGMSETFSPHPLQRKPLVSEPGMHHGTCVTHVPWCMSGSLMAGKTFPAFPDHAQPAILRIWQEAHASPKLVIPLVCTIHGFYDALVLRPRAGKGVTRFVRPIGPTIHRSYGPLARQLLGLPYKPRLVIPLVGTTHSSHNLLVLRPISPGHKAMKVNILSWLYCVMQRKSKPYKCPQHVTYFQVCFIPIRTGSTWISGILKYIGKSKE